MNEHNVRALTFSLDFSVFPKGRPRMSRRGHVFTPQRTRDCENAIGIVALGARNAAGLFQPFRGDCTVVAEIAGDRRSDLDNRIKLLADALNGIIYLDDKQIVEWNARLIKPTELTTVTITEIGDHEGSARRERTAGKRKVAVRARKGRDVVNVGVPGKANRGAGGARLKAGKG